MGLSFQDSRLLLLQLAAMLAAAVVFGQVARRLRLPVVFGELLGGILLGPTVFGALAPGSFGQLFPVAGQTALVRDSIARIGLLCFLLTAGLELRVAQVRKQGLGVLWASLFGIALPFGLGYLLVAGLPGFWALHSSAGTGVLALFMGAALSISALPIIARILMDLGLSQSPLATVVLASATIDDLLGWSLFAGILSHCAAGPAKNPWVTLALILGLCAFVLTAGRALVGRVRPWLRAEIREPGVIICIVAVLTLLLAATTDAIGIHALFGAFLAGVALAHDGSDRDPVYAVVQRFGRGVFAPFYFVSVGMKVDFVSSLHPAALAAILAVACLGKIIGASFGARLGGLGVRESLAVGFCMNARGALEMVLASVAMVTTLASAPLVAFLGLGKKARFRPSG